MLPSLLIKLILKNVVYISRQVLSEVNLGIEQTLVLSRPFKLWGMKKKKKDCHLLRSPTQRKEEEHAGNLISPKLTQHVSYSTSSKTQ